MGALHDGHLHLFEKALEHADKVVVSIFINPTQFAESEDLSTYPRDLDGDLKKLESRGAHLAFVPERAEVYPEGFATTVSTAGPAKAGLEDKHRRHFFDGVTTVVAKLLIQAQCDFAIFGEKDYQQLMVVTKMASDLDIPTAIIGAETVREADGLAMSSRNLYLSEKERKAAPLLHQSLQAVARRLKEGIPPEQATSKVVEELASAGFDVDYFEARNATTLEKLRNSGVEPLRILAAARLGKTRLIDNIGVK